MHQSLAYHVDEVFDGPLDLLCHLLQKNKLRIDQIPIHTLLTQYLAYIEQMKTTNTDIAGEFLAMASHLVYLKTLSLLPRCEEAQALKEELTGQLLEYQLCKEVSQRLEACFCGHTICIREPQKLETNSLYLGAHQATELIEAYLRIAHRQRRRMPPSKAVFSALISTQIVSVSSRISFVLKKLSKHRTLRYVDFFGDEEHSKKIATFLAILELIKSGRIAVSADGEDVSLQASKRKDD